MNCAQAKEQLIDFLYEELTPDLHAAFVEHLRTCADCSAEVLSHQKALGRARAALAGPLLEEPPARVHAAVLAAARNAATAKRDQPGFFERFWRTPWLLPAFGAVSVATAVFLVKVLKNPEGLPGRKAPPVDELSAPAPAVAPPPARPTEVPAPSQQAEQVPAPGPAATADKAALDGTARSADRARAKTRSAQAAGKTEARPGLRAGAPAGGALPRFAEPPPPRIPPKDSRFIDDLLGEVGTARKPASVPAERGAPEVTKRRALSREQDGLADYGRPPSTTGPATKKKMAAEEISEATNRPSGFAPPPPPVAAPAAAPAPSRPSTPARAASSDVAPTSRYAHGQEVEKGIAPAPEPMASAAEEPSKERARAGKNGPSLDESVKKAERLFAAQSWTAAAEAYRDLLRRFPSHKDAPKWRDRISQSLFAEENRRRANEAKASEVLKGQK